MKKEFAKLKNNNFVRSVMIIATGTAVAQVISMISSPIVTRIYGPEAFGLMGVFLAIVQIVGPVAALTYPISVVLPKSDIEARELMKLSIYISCFMGLIFFIIIVVSKDSIAMLFQIEGVAKYLYLLPVVIFFSGVMQAREQWLIRAKQFKDIATVTFLQALIINFGKVIVGLFYPFAGVLIVITATTNGIKGYLLALFSKKNTYNHNKQEENKSMSKWELLKKYNDFPKFKAPQVFINGVSQNIPILLLTSFFGPASAGFYAIGRTVLGIPSQLIGKSVGDVFYPRIVDAAKRGENTYSLVKKATISLGLIGIIPFGTVIAFGPWLFSFVFGEEWIVAGEYARWMAFWFLFIFINQPSIKALPVLSAQFFHLVYTNINIIFRTGALLLGYYLFKNDIIAIAYFSVASVILNIILILCVLTMCKKFDKRQSRIIR